MGLALVEQHDGRLEAKRLMYKLDSRSKGYKLRQSRRNVGCLGGEL